MGAHENNQKSALMPIGSGDGAFAEFCRLFDLVVYDWTFHFSEDGSGNAIQLFYQTLQSIPERGIDGTHGVVQVVQVYPSTGGSINTGYYI